MISMIAAISENNCIGKNGDLPWNLPEDMAYFRATTKGKPVIMGRKTWESIPKKHRPLVGRKNIIITRQIDYPAPEGVVVCTSLSDAIAHVQQEPEAFIIGGAQLYSEGISIADKLYITHVPMHVDGDTFFPEIDSREWNTVSSKKQKNLIFCTYERIK